MKAKYLQWALAAIFLGLGGWCLVAPGQVETLGLRPEHRMRTEASAVFIGCFGAQAMLCGVLMLTAEFRPRTFLVFGLVGSLPFFAFNAYFYFVAQMFTDWMLLDLAGNVGILACGLWGWRLALAEEG